MVAKGFSLRKLLEINPVVNHVNLRRIDAQLLDGCLEERALGADRIDARERPFQFFFNPGIGADAPPGSTSLPCGRTTIGTSNNLRKASATYAGG